MLIYRNKLSSVFESNHSLLYFLILFGTLLSLVYCFLLELNKYKIVGIFFFPSTLTNNVSSNTYHKLEIEGIHKKQYLEIVVETSVIDKSERNIFFIETSCATSSVKQPVNGNKIVLRERDVCAIESSLRMNPNHSVYCLYTCPLNHSIMENSPDFVKHLFLYENFKIVKLIMSDYFKGTYVEHLEKDRILDSSVYPLEHTSDVLRFVTLWKYGGTYMDLDVLNLRPLIDLHTNYVGFESNMTIGSAILNFGFSGPGNKFLTKLLVHLNSSFNGLAWGDNGPVLVTKMLLELCDNKSMFQARENKVVCGNFTIYNTEFFYPIKWQDWNIFFSEEGNELTLRKLEKSYCVHVWNKHSHKKSVLLNSKQLYEHLSRNVCPLTHSKFKELY